LTDKLPPFFHKRYASGVVKIWDLSTHLVVTLPPSAPLPGEGEPGVRDGGGITAVCFFDDALVTASSTGVLQKWHFRYAPGQAHTVSAREDAGHTESYLPRVSSLRNLSRPGSDLGTCSRCGSHEVLHGAGQLVRNGVPFVTLARRGSSPGPKFTLGEGDVDDSGNHGATSMPPHESTALTFHRAFSKAVHKSAVSELMTTTSNQLISTSRDNLIKLCVASSLRPESLLVGGCEHEHKGLLSLACTHTHTRTHARTHTHTHTHG
jgi:hypothetical protein